ncbi:uncharacterized protein LOC130982289 [Arachis stenosperma]|uniref:uncharacterized protein LOC130982289 n=1 Tax=Arachis stenosperma TaxID=217475 RepID=UPI0025AC0307|nr:uncharacterized protein LOC130982289 [Arachis stenosperma]
MGLLSWWKGKKSEPEPPNSNSSSSVQLKANGAAKPTEVPGMNGAVEVPRPPDATVSIFEFGSVAATNDRVTLAGYCPVSEELEPCRWEFLPAIESNAPQFRVVF